MNIVKILGLSFDKKKLQDLRYGKAQRSWKCITQRCEARIQLGVLSVHECGSRRW